MYTPLCKESERRKLEDLHREATCTNAIANRVFSTGDIEANYPSGKYDVANVEVKYIDDEMGWGLFARKNIGKGELVYSVPTIMVSQSVELFYLTDDGARVPICHNYYLTKVDKLDEDGKQMYEFSWFDIFLNHSCEGNVFYDETSEKIDQVLTATKDIQEGDQLLVNYNTIDWINPDPFLCKCKSTTCAKIIRGFRYLHLDVREQYMNQGHVTEYVKEMNANLFKTCSASEKKNVQLLKK